MRHRRWGIAAVCIGAALLVGSAAFRVVGTPVLVRFPLNVDETTRYTGTSSTFVDQATLLPLAHPKREPAVITRHVKVLSGNFSRAVIEEVVTLRTGSTTDVQTYQYVIDRRSMKMVSDSRQYAFGNPHAVMHAAGAYRVNFAMGTRLGGSYLAYIPEEDATSRLVPVEGPHTHPDVPATVIDFASHRDGPVAPYFLAHLKALGLPMQVTAAQLEPLLRAAGIDVNRALNDVGPRLSPAESRLVSATLARPVPLRYFFLSNGVISIEPKTGALLDVHTKEQGIAVQPDLRGASVLQPLLRKYAAIPSVKALSDGLAAMAARPPQVAQRITYTQTIPSSSAAARSARDHAATMNLVKVRVPLLLALLGLIALGAGLVLLRRGRKDRHAAAGSHPLQEPPEAEPAPTATPEATHAHEGV
jgi:hypothetical protein